MENSCRARQVSGVSLSVNRVKIEQYVAGQQPPLGKWRHRDNFLLNDISHVLNALNFNWIPEVKNVLFPMVVKLKRSKPFTKVSPLFSETRNSDSQNSETQYNDSQFSEVSKQRISIQRTNAYEMAKPTSPPKS
uniref:Uncharacterized protein n=1 Tax=Romanomermis culicivorax TaxID=13658 RepID=A0A915IZC4_ROMCU